MLIGEIFKRASCSRPPPACPEPNLALTTVADINKDGRSGRWILRLFGPAHWSAAR